MVQNLVELKFSVIIEGEIEEDDDYNDIGELIAADMYEIFKNDEDYFEVFYRGVERYENIGL